MYCCRSQKSNRRDSGSDQNSDQDPESDHDNKSSNKSSLIVSDEVPKLIWDNDDVNDDFMEMAEEFKFLKDSLKHYIRHPKHGTWFVKNMVELEQIKNRYYNLLSKDKNKIKNESNKKQKRGGK